jgi:hypothetical protein
MDIKKKNIKDNIRKNVYFSMLSACLKMGEEVRPLLKQNQKRVFNSTAAKLEILLRESEMVKSGDPLHNQMTNEHLKFSDSLIKLLEAPLLGGEESESSLLKS